MDVPQDILNIDWLREMSAKNNTPPFWFGLGFIQLKLTPDTRIHFWLPWLKGPEREQVHNHRYNFTSYVLAGSLHKEIYEVRPFEFGIMFDMFTTTCAPSKEGEITTTTPVSCKKIAEFDLGSGSTYWFGHDQFHTTEGTNFAITYVHRESKIKSDAMVVKAKDATSICPFAETKPVDEIWQHIEKALGGVNALRRS